tara:strand:+ start:1453 stop:1680 length:228 start_codon:yes stop_codon:yes gene_type:complete
VKVEGVERKFGSFEESVMQRSKRRNGWYGRGIGQIFVFGRDVNQEGRNKKWMSNWVQIYFSIYEIDKYCNRWRMV